MKNIQMALMAALLLSTTGFAIAQQQNDKKSGAQCNLAADGCAAAVKGALSYQQALSTSTGYEQLRPFFSKQYLDKNFDTNPPEVTSEKFGILKANYLSEAKVFAKGRIEKDGHCDVVIEGLNSDKKKTAVNLRMIRQKDVWVIDGYRLPTGKDLPEIPHIMGNPNRPQ